MKIASCGIDCDKCNAFIATKNDDNSLREATAKEWSVQYNHAFKPEDINCSGCREDGAKIGHCNVCTVRKCAISKNLTHCGECPQFPCKVLSDFLSIFPDSGAENLQRLQDAADN